MPNTIGVLSLKGMYKSDDIFTFSLASGITSADVGKAVSLDTSGNNKVKLALDTEEIIGVLETVENRTVEGVLLGTVATAGIFEFAVNSDATASTPDEIPNTVGDYIVGGNGAAGAGFVNKLTSGKSNWRVIEVISNTAVVAAKNF